MVYEVSITQITAQYSTYKDKTQNGEELIFANRMFTEVQVKCVKVEGFIAEVGNILSVGNGICKEYGKELEV